MKNATQKKKSMLLLQREYLEKTMMKIDEMEPLLIAIDEMDDENLKQSYLERIGTIQAEADENYRIACDIENAIKR